MWNKVVVVSFVVLFVTLNDKVLFFFFTDICNWVSLVPKLTQFGSVLLSGSGGFCSHAVAGKTVVWSVTCSSFTFSELFTSSLVGEVTPWKTSQESFCRKALETFAQSFGLRRSAVVGSRVFVLLLIRRWTGLESSPWVGVFLCERKVWICSSFLCLLRQLKVLVSLTACSAFPLLWGYPGEDVLCSNSQLLQNALNSSDENWGPLSEMHTSGIP